MAKTLPERSAEVVSGMKYRRFHLTVATYVQGNNTPPFAFQYTTQENETADCHCRVLVQVYGTHTSPRTLRVGFNAIICHLFDKEALGHRRGRGRYLTPEKLRYIMESERSKHLPPGERAEKQGMTVRPAASPTKQGKQNILR